MALESLRKELQASKDALAQAQRDLQHLHDQREHDKAQVHYRETTLPHEKETTHALTPR